ncbi:MAG: acetolactate synthase small subunit [Deltaproteobacteria bacterium]|nr:acetolactate synthase small subunit [Deltaproteobacteria bacterium]
MEIKENTISILVNNKPDVMARIAGTFSGRGFNIETIAVNVTEDPKISKIVLTIWGNQDTIIKIEKQLNRMVDVLQVDDLTGKDAIRREMLLARVKADKERQDNLMKTIDTYKWKIVGNEDDYFILEVTGNKEDIENALVILKPLGMDNFTRTGTVALVRRNNNNKRG